MDAIEFAKNLIAKQNAIAPRMASNTPANALVVFDGWMGGSGGVSHDSFVKMSRELIKGEIYSVAEIAEGNGRAKVILNEVSGQWDITFFAAYK